MNEKIKSVCVYCGSRPGNSPAYALAAERLGYMIGETGLSLVYGAGSIGLMGIVARSAISAGAPVIGIIPEHLDAVEITQADLTEIHITHTMHDRKKMMFDRSDAFIVLPGGLGTLDETFEIMTWAQLSLHKKPVILVNEQGYWDPFVSLVDHVVNEGFASAEHARLLSVVDTVDGAVGLLAGTPKTENKGRSDLF